jgi:hypothetical protein
MKCIQCNKEFEAKRTTAKYCSDTCRNLAFRGVSVAKDSVAISVPEVSVAEQPTRTYKPLEYPEHLKEYTDHCHFCNHQFGNAPDGTQPLGWICSDCISKNLKTETL